MKRTTAYSTTRITVILIIAFCSVMIAFVRSDAEDAFKLRPGAKGDICLGCHGSFAKKLKSAHVHTPLRQGDCVGCHSPHASDHVRMLAAEPGAICSECHASVIPDKAKSSHKVVAEGNCVKCHDPHASDNRYNLTLAGNKLCNECHGDLVSAAEKAKYRHSPVRNGCLNCHEAHGSAVAPDLLKKDVPGLCKGCHQTDKPFFLKVHENYPVANSRCTSCHNPHGSSKRALLYDTVHPPVASKSCGQCHEAPSSPNPLRTKKTGLELCRGCHYETVNAALSKNRIHWPVVDQKGCMNCHSPHASKQLALLKQDTMTNLCRTCHKDTIERQEKAVSKHNPVDTGMCMVCHSPHASDSVLLLNDGDVNKLCGTCHDFSRHSTHPIGEKAPDPRNKNLSLDCLSCHKSHGSEQKRLTHFQFGTELCVQCHQKLKR